MKGGFSKLLKKFCLDGTVMGLKYFYYYPDCFSRLFWAAFIMFIAQFACMITYKLYCRFDGSPTRIAIENQYDDVNQLPLPAITICSPNQITLSALRHFEGTLVDGNHTIDLEAVIPQLLGFYQVTNLDPGSLAHLNELIEINRYDLTEVILMLAQPCDQFLKTCFFRKKRRDGCRGIFSPILTAQGICCIFNNQYRLIKRRRNERIHNFEPYQVQNTGLEHSLTVILDFNPEDAVTGTLLRSGATRVMFNDWTEFPADDESELVSYYSETFHSVHATYTYCSEDVKKLSPESRKCLFDDEVHLPYFRSYRNSDCDTMCYVRAVEQHCHCLMPFVPHLRLEIVCNATSLPCVLEAKLQMHQWLEKEQCECPRDCDFRRYQIDTIIGNLDGITYSSGIASQYFSEVKLNKSSSVMTFFFQTPAYVKQKQETVMSITTFFSNLGGVFGLCLGCSVVTVVEIFFYLYVCLRNCFIRKIRRVTKPYCGQYYSFHM